MQIHAVQFDIVWEDREANHRKVRDLVATAPLVPGDMIVLPEMFDVGFSMNTARTAQPADLPSDHFVAELASATECCVVAGIVSPLLGDRPANEAIAITPDGDEIARYRKMRPFTLGDEHEQFLPGDHHVRFAWADMQFAPFICYDLRFPELYRPAAIAGTQVLLTIANWPDKRSEHWVRLLQARAIENQAYVLGVNRCGQDPNLTYGGRSALFDPLGVTIFECDGEEQVASGELDAAVVQQWRKNFPALADAIQTRVDRLVE